MNDTLSAMVNSAKLRAFFNKFNGKYFEKKYLTKFYPVKKETRDKAL